MPGVVEQADLVAVAVQDAEDLGGGWSWGLGETIESLVLRGC